MRKSVFFLCGLLVAGYTQAAYRTIATPVTISTVGYTYLIGTNMSVVHITIPSATLPSGTASCAAATALPGYLKLYTNNTGVLNSIGQVIHSSALAAQAQERSVDITFEDSYCDATYGYAVEGITIR